jgi:hypothetical protein
MTRRAALPTLSLRPFAAPLPALPGPMGVGNALPRRAAPGLFSAATR